LVLETDFILAGNALSEAKNFVHRVHYSGLCKAKIICICEILHFVQNDKSNLGAPGTDFASALTNNDAA